MRGSIPSFRRVLSPACLLLASACGVAPDGNTRYGSSSDAAYAPLSLSPVTLPAGTVGQPYPTARIPLLGGDATVSWRVFSGPFPPGLRLGGDGSVSGTPSAAGTYVFEVRAASAADEARAVYTIAVDAYALVAEGLRFGDAWTGEEVRLVAAGLAGPVRFDVVENRSGGRFASRDEASGRATWLAGLRGGPGLHDLLRVAETSGLLRTATARVPVMPHPAPWHRAEFGTTDVWYVNLETKYGAHSHPTDFDAALARLGLRAAVSSGSAGSVAERLAAFYVRREVLRTLHRTYGRDPDGSPGLGWPISFPMEQPGPPFTRPPEGLALRAAPGVYNVLAVVGAGTAGGSGLAFQDLPSNELIENDSPSEATGAMGVFVDHLTSLFERVYASRYDLAGLVARPVGPADETALRALVYGLPDPGGRYALLRDVGTAFGREIGRTCAHEIGHSLGLLHTNPFRDGSVMNAGLFAGVSTFEFLPEDRLVLDRALPGPGRGSGLPSAKPVIAVPDLGTCERCAGAASGR